MLDFPVYFTGVVSFLFLVFASWCVGEGGEILGKKYDASIIGGLIIAWLNTAPETIFFVTALHSNNPRFAVGAVSGSSIVVCTVALGICLWVGSQARKNASIQLQPAVKKQSLFGFNLLLGLAAVFFYIWFLYNSLTSPVEADKDKEVDEEMGDIEEIEEEISVTKGALYLLLGGSLIVIFSSPFINAVVEVASLLKVNPILLAFFLAPIASEAPEILESISLSRKGSLQNINIAYSNLVGGTITKTTLLCGIFSFFGLQRGFVWESPSYTLSMSLLILAAGTAAGIGVFFQKQTKHHGMFLILIFVFTGVIQFATNSHYNGEIFPDEGFAHDDGHSLPVP